MAVDLPKAIKNAIDAAKNLNNQYNNQPPENSIGGVKFNQNLPGFLHELPNLLGPEDKHDINVMLDYATKAYDKYGFKTESDLLKKIPRFQEQSYDINDFSYSPAVTASDNKVDKESITKYLKSQGLSQKGIDAILKNIEAESNFNPTAHTTDTNGLPSIGLFQWNGQRAKDLEKYAYDQGASWTDPQIQLEFLMQELHQDKYKNLLESLQNNDSSIDKGIQFGKDFEVTANPYSRAIETASSSEYSQPLAIPTSYSPVVDGAQNAAQDAKDQASQETSSKPPIVNNITNNHVTQQQGGYKGPIVLAGLDDTTWEKACGVIIRPPGS